MKCQTSLAAAQICAVAERCHSGCTPVHAGYSVALGCVPLHLFSSPPLSPPLPCRLSAPCPPSALFPTCLPEISNQGLVFLKASGFLMGVVIVLSRVSILGLGLVTALRNSTLISIWVQLCLSAFTPRWLYGCFLVLINLIIRYVSGLVWVVLQKPHIYPVVT